MFAGMILYKYNLQKAVETSCVSQLFTSIRVIFVETPPAVPEAHTIKHQVI